ncbi:MAG: 23S rRNA (adenine(2030)-N(6))-methyltransferase RlmJ, partial [Hyphomicrobiaceae bacterium]
DVLKHFVLVLAIEHLKLKPQPFRVVDTHAGVGIYDLDGIEAGKTGEWQGGIGRLLGAELSPAATAIVAPYLAIVRRYVGERNEPAAATRRYPGSPLIARELLRSGDVLVANELHTEDRAGLEQTFFRDSQVKVLGLDGYLVAKSTLPPKERRGLVVIDPPFEVAGEFDRLHAAMMEVHRRFAGGIQLIWYPVKDAVAVECFKRQVAASPLPKTLFAELAIRSRTSGDGGLTASGVLVVNPPYTLPDRLAVALPELARVLSGGPTAGGRHDWGWLIEERLTTVSTINST